MKKLDNRGLTLVELVIAIAISTMIVGAAGLFLYNAERTYRVAEHSVNLQMETQILMEQMSNWIMEGNRIYYVDDDVDPANVTDNDILVIYYIPRDNGKNVDDFYPTDYSYDSSSLKASRRVIFSNGGKLYMKVDNNIDNAAAEFQSLVDGSAPALYSTSDVKDENLIGEFAYRFSVDKNPSDADIKELTSVVITMGLIEGKQSYTMSDVFSLRNGLHVIPTATPEPADEG